MGCSTSKVTDATHYRSCGDNNQDGRISAACNRSAELFLKDFFDAQMSGDLPMTIEFDKAEFSRCPRQSFIDSNQINSDDEAEVVEAIKTDPTLANIGSGNSFMIAAQFKNSNMKSSCLSPQEIEAILTKICDERQFEHLGWPINISYSDDFFMFEKGVRSFCFSGKNS